MDMEEDCWKHRHEAQVVRHLQSTCPACQMLLPRELNHGAFLLSWRLQGPESHKCSPSPPCSIPSTALQWVPQLCHCQSLRRRDGPGAGRPGGQNVRRGSDGLRETETSGPYGSFRALWSLSLRVAVLCLEEKGCKPQGRSSTCAKLHAHIYLGPRRSVF